MKEELLFVVLKCEEAGFEPHKGKALQIAINHLTTELHYHFNINVIHKQLLMKKVTPVTLLCSWNILDLISEECVTNSVTI